MPPLSGGCRDEELTRELDNARRFHDQRPQLRVKDTVLAWPGETVELALRFERHAVLYVLHCQNLEREDAGMMLNLEVL